MMQGYFFGRPMDVAALEMWIAARDTAAALTGKLVAA